MTDAVGKEILIEGADPRELYGPRNVYLDQMKSLHPQLRIVARGSSLKVLGSEAETRRFEERMEGLVAYYLKYGHISSQVIDQCFAGGIAAQEAPVDKDVIVYGNNGNIVRARTVNQLRLVKLYDRNDLLFAVGPAGSGKTYTAIALAVRALKEKQVRRIILTRPAVEAGEKLGFLPGDMKEKLDPYLQPLYDALNDMIPPAKLAKYLEEGTVQIAPLAYMRGRTLDNAFVILDEAQNTTLSQIIQMVSDAAATKAPIAKIADKVSGVFVPSVMGIALVTFVVWMLLCRTVGYALARGISVLVISCPCALVISIPLSFFGGIGGASARGILIKGSSYLEMLAKTDRVIFDKTGTLTRGTFAVTAVHPAQPELSEQALLQLAAAGVIPIVAPGQLAFPVAGEAAGVFALGHGGSLLFSGGIHCTRQKSACQTFPEKSTCNLRALCYNADSS